MKYYIQFAAGGTSMTWWGSSPPAQPREIRIRDANGDEQIVANPGTEIPLDAVEVTEQQYRENLYLSSPLKWIYVDQGGGVFQVEANPAWPGTALKDDGTGRPVAKTLLERLQDGEFAFADYQAARVVAINARFEAHFALLKQSSPEMVRESWPGLLDEANRFHTDYQAATVDVNTVTACASLLAEVLGDAWVALYSADPSTAIPDPATEQPSVDTRAQEIIAQAESVRIQVGQAKYKRGDAINYVNNYTVPANSTEMATAYQDIENRVNTLTF